MTQLKSTSTWAVLFFISMLATPAASATLTLSWDPPSDTATVGYVIWYGTGSQSYTQRIDVGANTSFSVTSLSNGSRYYFAVQAYDAAGQVSSMSTEVSGATPSLIGAPAPSTPSPSSGAPVPSTPTPSSGTPALPIIQSPGGAPAPPSLTFVPGTTVPPSLAPAPGTIATPLQPVSDVAPEAAADPLAPTAPTNLAATLRDGRLIDLRWTSPPQNAATSYRIEVGTAPGRSDVSSFTTGATSSFTLSDLSPWTYYFRVRGVNDAGAGEASNEVAVALQAASGGADAPQNLQAVVNGNFFQLTWQAPPDVAGVSGYVLEAGSTSGHSNLAVLGIADTSFSSPVVPNGRYYLRVRAVRAGAAGSASNEVTVSVGGVSAPCVTPPMTPAGFSVAANGTVVSAVWQPGSGEPPTGYLLEVGSAAGRRDLAVLNFNASTTSFGSPAPNGTYVFRIAALNSCGASPASPEMSVTIGGPAPIVPGVPGLLTQDVTGSAVSLTWTAPTAGGGTSRYIIEATDTMGSPLATVDTGNASTSFTHGAVGTGVYVVRVRAANAAGVGPASEAVTVTVKP